MENQVAAQQQEFEWPPLESNPDIFTEYLHAVGMSKQWAVGEVFGFDEELLAFLPQPVVGVIVAIERLKKADDTQKGSADLSSIVPYYQKQHGKLDNACGIIACLHAALNNLDQIALEKDSVLEKFQQRVQAKTPEERANELENDKDFQQQHKGHAAQGQSNMAANQSEVKHHFVAFVVNKDKQLVELDGTKKGPLVIEEGCQDVLRASIKEIQKRLGAGDISESLSMMTLNAAA